ncbi:MAG: hypothetical protein AAGA69_10805, partial [Pseudomonadota bacterium]
FEIPSKRTDRKPLSGRMAAFLCPSVLLLLCARRGEAKGAARKLACHRDISIVIKLLQRIVEKNQNFRCPYLLHGFERQNRWILIMSCNSEQPTVWFG